MRAHAKVLLLLHGAILSKQADNQLRPVTRQSNTLLVHIDIELFRKQLAAAQKPCAPATWHPIQQRQLFHSAVCQAVGAQLATAQAASRYDRYKLL